MKKQWVGSIRKRFYGEMWGNAARGGGACENPVRLSMQGGPMETVKYMWMNIWCMPDWVTGLVETHLSGIWLPNW